jgi:hypothetical protein
MGMCVSEQGAVDPSGRFGVMGRGWDGFAMELCRLWLVFVKVRRRRVLRILHFSGYLHIELYNT